ncbi:acyltransferase family protein [Brachybacterium tyrofermentans]|uniref:acyltransferase family protein n=1 Tax=Brachybacterium tyrofermentans TaxID=47848 RepID=UPI003FD19F43
MTITQASRSPRTAPTSPTAATGRDPVIDLVRALCVVAIVLLHGLQMGVTVGPYGPVLEYTTVGASWYPPVTWLLQVLPVFFVIGGFSGMLAFRRLRDRGGIATDFVVGRVHRLLLPAVVTISVVAIALAVLQVRGVPTDLLLEAGLRYSQPLWFLGVFLGSQTLLPAMLRAHERAPLGTLAVLGAGALGVDALRSLTGVDAVGYANLAFVWLALQQLGFFLAEGRLDALRPVTRMRIGAGAVALLAGAFALGIFSPDLIAQMNPPTSALILVGVAQTAAFTLLRPTLAALITRPRISAVTAFVTARTMTLYLWNLPVLLTMAGVSAYLAEHGGLLLPDPSGLLWWTLRPSWLVLSLVLTATVAWVLGGMERRRLHQPTTSSSRALQAVLLALAGVLIPLLAGTTVLTAMLAAGLFLAALSRVRAPRGSRGLQASGVPKAPEAPHVPGAPCPSGSVSQVGTLQVTGAASR